MLLFCFFMVLTAGFARYHHSERKRPSHNHSVVQTMSSTACTESHTLDNEWSQGNISIKCHIDTNSSNIADLSLCPWEQHIDVDNERIPRIIPFAKCRCLKCSGDLSNTPLSCQPVYKSMTVWKKNNSRFVQYHQTWLRVPIACACSVPILLGSARK